VTAAGKRISVLHVTQPTEAGVGGFVSSLVADQAARNFAVHLACPPGSRLSATGVTAGADFHAWPATRSPGATLAIEAIRLNRIVTAVQPDLVHLHSSKAGLAGRLAVRGRLPTIFQPNAWSFEALRGPLREAAAAWERLSTRWTAAVICVSAEELNRGKAAGIRAQWHVVPNGIDVEALRETPYEERFQAREHLDIPAAPLVVCVGRLSRQKGQDVLLEAWDAVLKRVPSAQLIFVGEGPEGEQLRARASPGVLFAGHRDDVMTWLAAADVVALPSRWEGMSFAMLEAMACGRSLVATDVPGAREALGEGSGAIVPPERPLALADALVERLLDPRKTAAEGRAGRLRVERNYNLATTARAIAELYQELLASGRPRPTSSGSTKPRNP
jgi:glycosyltransferase involved in cell wall biosynthesis